MKRTDVERAVRIRRWVSRLALLASILIAPAIANAGSCKDAMGNLIPAKVRAHSSGLFLLLSNDQVRVAFKQFGSNQATAAAQPGAGDLAKVCGDVFANFWSVYSGWSANDQAVFNGLVIQAGQKLEKLAPGSYSAGNCPKIGDLDGLFQ